MSEDSQQQPRVPSLAEMFRDFMKRSIEREAILAQQNARIDKGFARIDKLLGKADPLQVETKTDSKDSVFLETSPIAILPGTTLPVEILGEVDSPISDSSEDVTVEATSVPALEPVSHPFGVQVSEDPFLKAQLPLQVAVIIEADRPQPAPNFPTMPNNILDDGSHPQLEPARTSVVSHQEVRVGSPCGLG